MRKLFIILWLFMSVVMPTFGSSEVQKADSAYLEGDYTKAIDLYNEIASSQGVSAPLLFNLGNAYMKNDDYGQAMLAYLRAKRLDPSNSQITGNLSYLKEKVEDANKAEQRGKKKKVTEDTPNFFQTIHSRIAEDHSSNSWAGWAAAFFIIFAGCGALYLFTSNVLVRKFGFFGGFIFLGLSIIFIVCAYSAANAATEREYGVVVAYKVPLLTEPNESDGKEKEEDIVTRGTRMRIISEEVDAEGVVTWYKVRLNSDYIGWLKAEDLEII